MWRHRRAPQPAQEARDHQILLRLRQCAQRRPGIATPGAWPAARHRPPEAAPSDLRSRSATPGVRARLPCAAWPASAPRKFRPRAPPAPSLRSSSRGGRTEHRASGTIGAAGFRGRQATDRARQRGRGPCGSWPRAVAGSPAPCVHFRPSEAAGRGARGPPPVAVRR